MIRLFATAGIVLGLAAGVHSRAQDPGLESLLTVASLNLQEKSDLPKLMAELDALAVRPDILFLQEVERGSKGQSPIVEGLGTQLGLPYTFASPQSPEGSGVSPRLATLSKYPISRQSILELPRHDLVFKSRKRCALDVTIETGEGSLRTFNLHLDSRINRSDRLLQLGPILEDASEDAAPMIIAGDLNSNGFFWLFHLVPVPFVSDQKAALVEALAARGFTTPFDGSMPTHDFLGLKLDWIFGRQIAWTRCGIEPLDSSDHHLLWAELEWRRSRPRHF